MEQLTREEFKQRLDAGQRFKEAYLYEPDHAPKGTEFYLVDLGGGLTVFKRRVG